MKNSAIQWTDHTFNAWEGCTKVAPECKNCYAETLVDHRFGRAKWGKGQPRRRTSSNLWKQPIAWNRTALTQAAISPGFYHRPRVFCLSLGDWLDEEVPIRWRTNLFQLIRATPNLDWQLLTKRPQNFKELLEWSYLDATEIDGELSDWLCAWQGGDAPPNIWIGVSAGADIETALDIPAKIHFLSCEPMLHALDTSNDAFKHFDWIIFGGESGKNARPCDVDWIRQGVRFCRENSVAAFVKQLGKRPFTQTDYTPSDSIEVERVTQPLNLHDSHGGDWLEWPEDLRIREFP